MDEWGLDPSDPLPVALPGPLLVGVIVLERFRIEMGKKVTESFFGGGGGRGEVC